MQIKERTWSSSSYKHGFNGMEKDDEVKGEGNSLDFGARIYDGRLGRWLSVDPFARKFPNMSTYAGFGNNPILLIDTDGKEFKNPYTKYRKFIQQQVNKQKQLLGQKYSKYGTNIESLKRKSFRKSGLKRGQWKKDWKGYKSVASEFHKSRAKLSLISEKETQINNALKSLESEYPTVYEYFNTYQLNGKDVNILLFNDLITSEEYAQLSEFGSTFINNEEITGAQPKDRDFTDFQIVDFTGDAIPIELKMLRFGEKKPIKSKSSLKILLHELGHFLAETKYKSDVDSYYKNKDRDKDGGHGAGSPTGDMADKFESKSSDFDPSTIKP
jgi:RHS repeat-associated protein